jgi:HSP20 family protein
VRPEPRDEADEERVKGGKDESWSINPHLPHLGAEGDVGSGASRGKDKERSKPEKEVQDLMLPSSGRGFYDPHSEMNRLFDEMFGGLNRRSGGQQRAQGIQEWAPAIDVVQDEGDLVVRAELPGVKLEDVDMTVHRGVLTISGKREEQGEEERGGYLVRERRSGSFRRSLQLPEGVNEDSIRARFENGVLEVTIKGAAAAQGPKRIQVEGPSGERSDSEGSSS